MDEPIIKKKTENQELVKKPQFDEEINLEKKNNFFKNNLVPNIKYIIPVIAVIVVLIFGVKSFFNNKETIKEKELVFEADKMQVILKSKSDTYILNGNNILKDKTNDYHFTLVNTGNQKINYYELRIVNQEDHVSTLPYKYLKFSLNNEKEQLLSDDNGIIYHGKDLDLKEEKDFHLKIWLDDLNVDYYDKSLYLAVEVTLFNEYDDNYVYYSINNQSLKTSIYEPITSYIPTKEGYEFIGWGTDNEVLYKTNDVYKESKGMTLYPIFQEKEKVVE